MVCHRSTATQDQSPAFFGQRIRWRRYRRRYWLAQWQIGNGKAGMKKFSIQIYGERDVFQQALRASQEALKRLPF